MSDELLDFVSDRMMSAPGEIGHGVDLYRSEADSLADATLTAIRERHAIVELPEPDNDRADSWADSSVHLFRPAHGPVSIYLEVEPGEPQPLRVNDARTIAAALLAAADAAERAQ